MKRLLLLFAVIVLLPVPKRGELGAYNTFSRLAYCSDASACLHEIGHALDQKADWISQGPQFAEALQMYLLTNRDEIAIRLSSYLFALEDNKPVKKELYAYLFQMAQGKRENMPQIFIPFYDWEQANDYISRLDDSQLYWMY